MNVPSTLYNDKRALLSFKSNTSQPAADAGTNNLEVVDTETPSSPEKGLGDLYKC